MTAWDYSTVLRQYTDGVQRQITYDLATQLTESDLPALRSQILLLLKRFAPGPKPVRVQLCVCLASLAIQMRGWNDVLPMVVSSLDSDVESHSCILDFLRVLPEEVTEGRKINLSVRGLRNNDLLALTSTGPKWWNQSCGQNLMRS